RQRDDERVLAADQVANAPEKYRSKWPDQEAHSESRQVSNISKRIVSGWIELRRQNRRQTPENVEVIPFDHRAYRRCHDDQGQTVGMLSACSPINFRSSRHAVNPPRV